jgi:hypothetical protein
MNASQRLNRVMRICENHASELAELLPNHPLLRFDAEGKSDDEKDTLLDQLFLEFNIKTGHIPSDNELILAFQLLGNALEAAVAIEKAKIGVFRPLEGSDDFSQG